MGDSKHTMLFVNITLASMYGVRSAIRVDCLLLRKGDGSVQPYQSYRGCFKVSIAMHMPILQCNAPQALHEILCIFGRELRRTGVVQSLTSTTLSWCSMSFPADLTGLCFAHLEDLPRDYVGIYKREIRAYRDVYLSLYICIYRSTNSCTDTRRDIEVTYTLAVHSWGAAASPWQR